MNVPVLLNLKSALDIQKGLTYTGVKVRTYAKLKCNTPLFELWAAPPHFV